MVVLDTDHLSLLEWRAGTDAQHLRTRLRGVDPASVVSTIVSFEEQMRGWLTQLAKARTMAQQVTAYSRLSRHVAVFREVPLLEFDERAAAEFQRLRRSYRRIGSMDLKIAAIVLVQGATLLTRNLGDFGKIDGLLTEDWTGLA
jgi:tRNA(fMet)-specific endonuclease VapC